MSRFACLLLLLLPGPSLPAQSALNPAALDRLLIALPGYGIGVARTIDEKRGRAGNFGFSTIYEGVLDLVRPAKP